MRINSSVWLLLVLSFIVVLESVSSYPAKDAEESVSDTTSRPLTSVRKHSKSAGHMNKKKKQHAKNGEHRHHHHHSSRGLKQVADYDYAAMAEQTATTAGPAQRKKIKDDQSPWSPKRRNKKSNNRKNKKNNKNNKKNDKRQAVRTTRRAGSFNDQNDLDDAGHNQLLGLGVFGDMKKFFDELRSNLDVEAAAAESEGGLAAPNKQQNDNPTQLAGLEDYEDLPNYQALRTTSGLDASSISPVQQQRRYSRLRGFVAMGGPGSPSESSRHHRNHPYDPALLWTGLGRRR